MADALRVSHGASAYDLDWAEKMTCAIRDGSICGRCMETIL